LHIGSNGSLLPNSLTPCLVNYQEMELMMYMFLFLYDPNFSVLIQLAMVQFHQQMSALRMILIKGFKKTLTKLCAKALVPFLFVLNTSVTSYIDLFVLYKVYKLSAFIVPHETCFPLVECMLV